MRGNPLVETAEISPVRILARDGRLLPATEFIVPGPAVVITTLNLTPKTHRTGNRKEAERTKRLNRGR